MSDYTISSTYTVNPYPTYTDTSVTVPDTSTETSYLSTDADVDTYEETTLFSADMYTTDYVFLETDTADEAGAVITDEEIAVDDIGIDEAAVVDEGDALDDTQEIGITDTAPAISQHQSLQGFITAIGNTVTRESVSNALTQISNSEDNGSSFLQGLYQAADWYRSTGNVVDQRTGDLITRFKNTITVFQSTILGVGPDGNAYGSTQEVVAGNAGELVNQEFSAEELALIVTGIQHALNSTAPSQ